MRTYKVLLRIDALHFLSVPVPRCTIVRGTVKDQHVHKTSVSSSQVKEERVLFTPIWSRCFCTDGNGCFFSSKNTTPKEGGSV